MLEKGFLTARMKKASRLSHRVSMLSSLLFYAGAIVVLFSLVYMMLNLSRSDSFIGSWLPFMLGGLGLIAVSYLIGWVQQRRKG